LDEKKCGVTSAAEFDFDVLKGTQDGTLVTEENYRSIRNLASVGLVRFGTAVVDRDDGLMELHQTAGATNLGKRIIKHK
jgi:hypothetical protein